MLVTPFSRSLALALVILASACGRSPQRVEVTGDAPAASSTDATDPKSAIVRPHHLGAAKLGAHRFTGSSKTSVTDAAGNTWGLEERAQVEASAAGELHALYENSKDYGRELYAAAGTVWIRPRYGKFHQRPPADPEEPTRVVDEIFGAFGAHFELVAHAAKLGDAGKVEAAGRPAKKLTLALDSGGVVPKTAKGWRSTVVVKELGGEIVLDEKTGALLSGKLQARVSYAIDGRTHEMTLESTHEIRDVGGAVAITPPDASQSVATPQRSTEFEERNELLEGLAPAAKKSGGPH